MTRLPSSEIELDDYVYFHEGKPFSGVIYETDRDGRVWQEQTLREGIPDGPTRIWHHNGALKLEENYKSGLLHGLYKELNEDGTPVLEELYEYGVCILSKKWTPDGVTESQIDPASDDYRMLEARRKASKP